MKKLISFLLCLVLFITPITPAVSAEYTEAQTEYFADGSYLTVTYDRVLIFDDDDIGNEEYFEDATGEDEESTGSFLTRIINWIKRIIKMLSKQKNISKTKYCYYYDTNGTMLWYVALRGDFTYNGKKSACVGSNIYCYIKDPDWKNISAESSENGNTAKGEFAIRQYKLGVPLKLIEKTLTLTCDKNGNVE